MWIVTNLFCFHLLGHDHMGVNGRREALRVWMKIRIGSSVALTADIPAFAVWVAIAFVFPTLHLDSPV